ncbi:MAG: RtcB family protein [Eubacteriaceae bacterium]|nr:RtcB family protein [Eubacteriaceae bacterium]
MFAINGKYNTAIVYAASLEEAAIEQIKNMMGQEFAEGLKIRIMPDAHVGVGCTIGTTMTVAGKVVPNLVGVDIGCGIDTITLKQSHVQLQKLDKAVHNLIPSGFKIRKEEHSFAEDSDIGKLRCVKNINLKRAYLSIGTLGGGNHFIELGTDIESNLYFAIHSGSRNLGKQVAEHYQRQAVLACPGAPKSLAYCSGDLLDDYLHDMEIVQRYASLNRQAIAYELTKEMGFKATGQITTIHNYIDTSAKPMILRKGAVSAKNGEKLLIPINMRDGSLLCVGKGNEDWNYSSPHGAGRLMSRSAAKSAVTLGQFKESMQGIYTTTVNRSTIDESPFAYKPMEDIIANVSDTVDILCRITPLYNFKAAE